MICRMRREESCQRTASDASDQGEDDIKSFMSQGDIECLSFWRDTLEESCFFLNDDKDEKIQQQQESN